MEGWMTTKGERRDYGLYLFGQNIIYALVTTFLAVYLTMQGISPVMVAPVLLVIKAWDAVNDVIFGGIFDKIKFKKGKFVPWLKISLPFIPLATFLMFAIPNVSVGAKLAWVTAMYVLWDTAYTLCDIPIYGLVTTMTSNLQERTAIMSYAKLYVGGGVVVAYGLGTFLVSQTVGLSYTTTALICSVVALLAMAPISFRGQERNYDESEKEESFTFREMFRYLGKNKYLLIFYGAYVLNGCLNTANGLGMFVAYYLFGNEMYNLVLGALIMFPAVILAVLIPKMIKKIDKFKLFFWGSAAATLLGFVIYFVGYASPAVFMALSVLRAIPLAFPMFLAFMFTPDCAEYGRFKSGTDAKGITFAVQTFSAKITGSIATPLGLALIGMFGFVSHEADSFAALSEMGAAQSPQALNGLWTAYALVPAIGGVVMLALLWLYKLNDKDVQVMSDCNAGLISREEAEERLSRQY